MLDKHGHSRQILNQFRISHVHNNLYKFDFLIFQVTAESSLSKKMVDLTANTSIPWFQNKNELVYTNGTCNSATRLMFTN